MDRKIEVDLYYQIRDAIWGLEEACGCIETHSVEQVLAKLQETQAMTMRLIRFCKMVQAVQDQGSSE